MGGASASRMAGGGKLGVGGQVLRETRFIHQLITLHYMDITLHTPQVGSEKCRGGDIPELVKACVML